MNGLYWVRTDLRLQDNHALRAFSENCTEGIVVWAPTLSYFRAGEIRKKFIDDSVQNLKNDLAQHGISLQVLEKPFFEEMPRLTDLFKIETLYFTREFAIEEVQEEFQVKAFCQSHQI